MNKVKRFFLDTEFIEDGETIDLISISIVDEQGFGYYALNLDCDLAQASDWVKQNVIAQLPPQNPTPVNEGGNPRIFNESRKWRTKEQIAIEVVAFIKQKCLDLKQLTIEERNRIQGDREYLWNLKLDYKPEFWAYYADYDWVVFCQLFGTMMNLPKYFPFYCNDLKQECDRLGNPKLPSQEKEHNALEDAKWNRKVYSFLQQYKTNLSLYTYEAEVIRVIDGDTFIAQIDRGFSDYSIKSIRLGRINAPEVRKSRMLTSAPEAHLTKKNKLGLEAKLFLEKCFAECENKCVVRSQKVDGFGRAIGEIWIEKAGKTINVNELLVENGLAVFQKY